MFLKDTKVQKNYEFDFDNWQTIYKFAEQNAIIAQLVEHQLPKLRVAGSNPVYRSDKYFKESGSYKLN